MRSQWPAYVSVAERRLKAERAAAKLSKKGSVLSPVIVEGRKIATTFWGKAWCDNLESYRDYENRLERGRSYVRNGLVIDLQIAPHTVTAMVCGSSLYTVKITINEVPKAQWNSICADCAGGIDSLVELLQGRFSKGVMERICRQGTGLFPRPAEIRVLLQLPGPCLHVQARRSVTVWHRRPPRCQAGTAVPAAWRERERSRGGYRNILPMTTKPPVPAKCWRTTIWRHCSVWIWATCRRRKRSSRHRVPSGHAHRRPKRNNPRQRWSPANPRPQKASHRPRKRNAKRRPGRPQRHQGRPGRCKRHQAKQRGRPAQDETRDLNRSGHARFCSPPGAYRATDPNALPAIRRDP